MTTDADEHYPVVLCYQLWRGVLAATMLTVLALCIAVRDGACADPAHEPGTVRDFTSVHLHPRLDPCTVPPASATLVSAFNAMLDQLQTSFERLARYSADIAHALRTPVTNLMSQTQVALSRERPVAAYREVLPVSLEELDRLRKMIHDMLFLARTGNSRHELGREEAILEAEVLAMFDFFEAWSEEAGVALRFEADAGAP